MKNIKVSLCSVPVEGWGVRLDRKRSEGSLGIMPKVAIVSLVDAMKKAGFPKSSYDFYDIDMLYPTDEEIEKYFNEKLTKLMQSEKFLTSLAVCF